jgi:molybdopterin converting factor small subunit
MSPELEKASALPRPVTLLAFAAAQDLVGHAQAEFALEREVSVAAFWELLVAAYPALSPHRGGLRLAVNGTYAFDQDMIGYGDEVALIPPVSGG